MTREIDPASQPLVVPRGWVRVRWICRSKTFETVEINDRRRISRAQLVVPDEGLFDVTSVYHQGDAWVAHCRPVTTAAQQQPECLS